MKQISVDDVLDKAGCLVNESGEKTYHFSYKYFVDFFSNQSEIAVRELVIGANFSYGWMPTILNFKSDEFQEAVKILNLAKLGQIISTEQVLLLKRLVNNSLVGVSKLLHFVNPHVYAIWDSRVCNFLLGTSYKHKVEKVELYWDYIDLCNRIAASPRFHAIHSDFVQQLGYRVSPLRTIEQIMFIGSSNPLNQKL